MHKCPSIQDCPSREQGSRFSSASEDNTTDQDSVDVVQASIQSNTPLVLPAPPYYNSATSIGLGDIEENATEGNKSLSDTAKMAANLAAVGRLYGHERHKSDALRLVKKTGESNVDSRNATKLYRSYLVDIFTTLVDMRWRLQALYSATAFVSTWCTFGLIWRIIAIALRDVVVLNDDTIKVLYNDTIKVLHNHTMKPFVNNFFDCRSPFLFSIETQTSMGYGYRQITDECWYADIFLMLQCCIGPEHAYHRHHLRQDIAAERSREDRNVQSEGGDMST